MTFVSYCGILSRFMFMSITPDFIGHSVLPFLLLQANMICRFVMARGVGGLPLRRPLSTSGQVRPSCPTYPRHTQSLYPSRRKAAEDVAPPARCSMRVCTLSVCAAVSFVVSSRRRSSCTSVTFFVAFFHFLFAYLKFYYYLCTRKGLLSSLADVKEQGHIETTKHLLY